MDNHNTDYRNQAVLALKNEQRFMVGIWWGMVLSIPIWAGFIEMIQLIWY